MAVPSTKVILLATSESNKLYPLTESIPTPMVPVVNRPIMAYVVELLARQGLKEIIVSLYHLPGQIEAYFGDGRRWGVSLEYALQGQQLGTAGSLKWAQSLLSDTFVVLPADVILDLDLTAALAHHHAGRCAATVIERSINSSTPDANFSDSIDQAHPASTGAYIFNSQVLDLIPSRSPFDIQSELLPAIIDAGHSVSCFEMDGYTNCLESFGDYQEIQETILNSQQLRDRNLSETDYSPGLTFFSFDAREFDKGIWIGRNQVIHPNARLIPPVYIGDNSYIGKDVELGPNTVIGSNVVIDDEATIARSTVLDGTYVGQLVNVDQRLVDKNLIIDLDTAEYTYVTDDFLLGQTYRPDINRGFKRVLDVLVALMFFLPFIIIFMPLAFMLVLTTGKIFRPVDRQFNRPMITGEPQPVIFRLLQFNVENRQGRYNWFGRLLMRLEVNRLPEWWNLLKGDLVLVGVKPLSSGEIGRLDEAWQQPRHEMRPGITGLWYTNTRYESTLDEIVVADIYYIATQSWREDLKILAKTPVCWFKRIRE